MSESYLRTYLLNYRLRTFTTAICLFILWLYFIHMELLIVTLISKCSPICINNLDCVVKGMILASKIILIYCSEIIWIKSMTIFSPKFGWNKIRNTCFGNFDVKRVSLIFYYTRCFINKRTLVVDYSTIEINKNAPIAICTILTSFFVKKLKYLKVS